MPIPSRKPVERLPILCYTCSRTMAYVHAEAVERGKAMAGQKFTPSSMALATIVSLGRIQCPACERASIPGSV